MKVAVAFGANGNKQFNRLRYAQADASALARTLKTERYAFTTIVIGGSCAPEAFLGTLRRACVDLAEEDVFICYVSCHGVLLDGDLYLVVNGTRAGEKRTHVPVSGVTAAFDECRAHNKLLILDCCNAGAAAKGDDAEAQKTLPVVELPNLKNQVVLFASDVFEAARESTALRAGFLRWSLCKALETLPPGDVLLTRVLGQIGEMRTDHNRRHPESSVPQPFLVGRLTSDFNFADPARHESAQAAVAARPRSRVLLYAALGLAVLTLSFATWLIIRPARRTPDELVRGLLSERACTSCDVLIAREFAGTIQNAGAPFAMDLPLADFEEALDAKLQDPTGGRVFTVVMSRHAGPDLQVYGQFAPSGAPPVPTAITTPMDSVRLPWIEGAADPSTVMQSGLSIPEMELSAAPYLGAVSRQVGVDICSRWPRFEEANSPPVEHMANLSLSTNGCGRATFIANTALPPSLPDKDRVRFTFGLPPLASHPTDALRFNAVFGGAPIKLDLILALIWVPGTYAVFPAPSPPDARNVDDATPVDAGDARPQDAGVRHPRVIDAGVKKAPIDAPSPEVAINVPSSVNGSHVVVAFVSNRVRTTDTQLSTIDLSFDNRSGDWCEFSVELANGTRLQTTGHMPAHTQMTLTIPSSTSGQHIKIQLWTQGFIGAGTPGDIQFTMPTTGAVAGSFSCN